ncbi:MAG: dTDP-4-dehydrorhamnose reductase [Candidatus Latescibacterota bacterium]
MRILITGCKGMLGGECMALFAREHEVSGMDLGDADLTDRVQTIEAIASRSPELVIHTAACTDVDGCEQHPDRAFRVNAIGTQNVALACARLDATMVYISTDFVFGGQQDRPYTEFDAPDPLSVYASSKLAGEMYVRALLKRWYIVRTSWLFGRHGKNFVETILRLGGEQDELRVVDDQIGTPTFAGDLVTEMARLVATEAYGIYHLSNKGSCSWFEFAQEILERAHVEGVRVLPISTEALARAAPRPAFSVLRNYCMELTIGDHMRVWEEGLAAYLELGR